MKQDIEGLPSCSRPSATRSAGIVTPQPQSRVAHKLGKIMIKQKGKKGFSSNQVIAMVRQCNGSISEAARQLGCSYTSVRYHLEKMNCMYLTRKYQESDMPVVRTTVETDAEGNVTRKWVSSAASIAQQTEEQKVEKIRQAIIDLKPAKPIRTPRETLDELVAAYVIGDQHLGLQACASETGTDWDLQKSFDTLCAAADLTADAAPAASDAVLYNLGDFFHTDNMQYRTMRSGNVLDVSTRYQELLRPGINAMKYWIDRLREKHRTVRVINVQGNHDDHSTLWLREALVEAYRNDDRVIIETKPEKYHSVRYGKVLLMATHGDTHAARKPERLALQLANDVSQEWGQSDYRHVFIGHVHHLEAKELPGVTVEWFRTLAARDAWAHNEGYRAQRETNCLVFHKEFGLTQRITKGIREIEHAMNKNKKAA